MSDRTRDSVPFARRAAPVLAVAAVAGALWRTLDSSPANSLRVTLRTPSRASHKGTGTPATTAPPAPGQTAPPGTTTTLASTVCAHPERVTGPVIQTQWGPVQVRADLGTGNHICSADAIQTPSDHDQSVYINQQAVPWIDDEVKTQGVNFDMIGGATITSDGYRASLQAILDSRSSTPST